MPSGMPTPRPIFCRFVSPSPFADGASGSAAALGLGLEVEVDEVEIVEETLDADVDADEDADEDEVVDALLEDLTEDLVKVENVTTEETIVVGLRVSDDCVALLGAEDDADGTVLEDCSVGDD